MKPGQITFCVMARNETCEPNRLISAAIGLAVPKDSSNYGYLSEHHTFGETADKSGDYAEDLAATMLSTTLGIEIDVEKAWDERKQEYIASGKIFQNNSHLPVGGREQERSMDNGHSGRGVSWRSNKY